ncbi:hypothetical protein BESB_022620 [Besnoitia besnoiti]|uniref:CCZ1/INTU/HSP4 first Longin domain-containing protein n=1 Tax=Besnoitia besnoiti TaxID=94643 RepID=A0A2A9M8P8_BESBE|nr:hypothetical protein BESB_022620 [Besnoitia besnoiti]PFH31770.1 hypothetical protein BESB_022620 [Besnoitia besnoiti]
MFTALAQARASFPLSPASASAAAAQAGPVGTGSAADMLGFSSPLIGGLQERKECRSPPVPHNGVEAIFLFNPTLKPERKRHSHAHSDSVGMRGAHTSSVSSGRDRRVQREDGELGDDDELEDEFDDLRGEEEDEGAHLREDDAQEEEEQELGAEERAQEAKIVFYFPSTRPAEEKRSHVGLIEGLTIFTRQFSGDSGPLRSIYTDDHVIVTQEVEPDYWLTFVFNASQLADFAFSGESKGDPKAVDGVAGHARLDEDNQDIILLGILDKFYRFFRLLHGRLALFIERQNQEHLTDLLEDFCPAFIDTIDPQHLTLFQSVDGFHFGPLDRLPYLHLPSFVSILQNKFPCILHTAFLLNGCLLFYNLTSDSRDFSAGIGAIPLSSAAVGGSSTEMNSGFSPRRQSAHASSSESSVAEDQVLSALFPAWSRGEEKAAQRERSRKDREQMWRRPDGFRDGYDVMRVLYSYLVHVQGCAAVDPDKLRKPPYARVNTAAARPGGRCSSFGRAIREAGSAETADDTPGDAFLFGPAGHSVFVPEIHLPDDSTGSIVVINQQQLQLVLVVNDHHLVSDASFLQHVRAFALEAGLAELQQVFSAEFDSIMKQEDGYRFIYFNHVNRAVRISNRKCPANAPSPPSFPGCALSKQEVRRMGQLHRRLCPDGGREDDRLDLEFVGAYSDEEDARDVCTRSPRGGTWDSRSDAVARRDGQRVEGERGDTPAAKRLSQSSDDVPPEARDVARKAQSFTDDAFGSSRATAEDDTTSARARGSGRAEASAGDGRQSGEDDARERPGERRKARVQPKSVPVKLMAVKDAQSGWLIGAASMNREFYVALDDPRTTLSNAMEDASRFGHMHFANIFV